MKIRNGFVSNSSSCSFLIYGVYEDSSSILECLKATGIVPVDTNSFGDWYWDGGEKELNEKGLIAETPYDGDYVAIGVSYDSIKDDETGKQFKERVAKVLTEIMGDKFVPGTCQEAWRDG